MFGKRISDYLAFQKVILVLIAVVGLVRLGLSIAGFPDRTVRFFAMTAVALAGLVYYGIAVHTRRFGSYKQLLPLVFFQTALANLIAILGIVLSIAGIRNIYGASEYSGPFAHSQVMHAVGHLTLGMLVPTLIGWVVASIVLLVAKRLA
jgi:hypothetical protein